MSTGPKTKAGRARIAEAQRRVFDHAMLGVVRFRVTPHDARTRVLVAKASQSRPPGREGPRRRAVRYRLRKCPAERQSFFLAGAFASSSNATPRALARRRAGIDADVHVPIKGSPDLPVRGLGDALPRYQHGLPVPRRA